jgi:hypothetical protein
VLHSLLARVVALFVLLFGAASASAHPPEAAIAQVTLTRDGRLSIVLDHDALAFALVETPTKIDDEPMYRLLRGSDADIVQAFVDGRERMAEQLGVVADGRAIALTITEAPTLERLREWAAGTPDQRLPLRLRFAAEGDVPLATKAIVLKFPPILGQVIVSLQLPGAEPVAVPIAESGVSPTFDVEAPLPAWRIAWNFAVFGFTHILPGGLDHCFFVIGLFLLVPRFKTVLWQISAFTVAHTITLTLTALHIIGLAAARSLSRRSRRRSHSSASRTCVRRKCIRGASASRSCSDWCTAWASRRRSTRRASHRAIWWRASRISPSAWRRVTSRCWRWRSSRSGGFREQAVVQGPRHDSAVVRHCARRALLDRRANRRLKDHFFMMNK